MSTSKFEYVVMPVQRLFAGPRSCTAEVLSDPFHLCFELEKS